MQSIRYHRAAKTLQVLDQRLLPHVTSFIPIQSVGDGWESIRSMSVRGAPAIAIVAVLSVAVDISSCATSTGPIPWASPDACLHWTLDQLEYLKTSRPTAVNLFDACARLKTALESLDLSVVGISGICARVVDFAEQLLDKDITDNKEIGRYGGEWIMSKMGTSTAGTPLRVLTHCNTGTLATSGYGTALGVMRYLHSCGALAQAYCTETRPYNQGSRLTAYELVEDNLPAPTLITDSMAAFLMKSSSEKGRPISAVVVGADRVAANGDTANKIGTYMLSVLARAHGVLFIVAAPTTSIDLSTATGDQITIEERRPEELTTVLGYDAKSGEMKRVSTAPESINVWNPAFDITPADFIDAIVTEVGVIEPETMGGGGDRVTRTFQVAKFLEQLEK